MPAFETQLSAADRWAVALYASTLRQARPSGTVPPELQAFPSVAVLTDSEVLAALGAGATAGRLAAVRDFQPATGGTAASAAIFATVRGQIARSVALARSGQPKVAADTAFDAYMEFEKVEGDVRARDASLASDLEAAFATLRTRAAGGATANELDTVQRDIAALLERAERVVSDRMSPTNLFIQSLVIMLREGFEAILIIGALIAFLVKAGAAHRRRDIHIGVGAAVAMSLLTAVLLETVFVLSSAHREALEGATMLVAVVVLFYVSYWLLSKIEVAKWTAFVKRRLNVAVSGGSAFALALAAFLAVYREGFETVLFYKALLVEAGPLSTTFLPVTAGILIGAAALAVVYVAINRWGVRIPLKPFFAVTSGFLYYMAFVFAGKGVAELQEGRIISETILLGWPRFPALGIYPTVESMAAQGLLALLAVVAVVWLFTRRRSGKAPPPDPIPPRPSLESDGAAVEANMLRSLERMDADLAAIRAEVERMRQTVVDASIDDATPR
ncbi:MAG: FTR1 family iron permease, partial [Gemmatimonadales bacterium]